MAKALLVKLYLNWAVYTCGDVANYEPTLANAKLNDAVKYCDEIIKSGKFNLSDSYRKKFMFGELPSWGFYIRHGSGPADTHNIFNGLDMARLLFRLLTDGLHIWLL